MRKTNLLFLFVFALTSERAAAGCENLTQVEGPSWSAVELSTVSLGEVTVPVPKKLDRIRIRTSEGSENITFASEFPSEIRDSNLEPQDIGVFALTILFEFEIEDNADVYEVLQSCEHPLGELYFVKMYYETEPRIFHRFVLRLSSGVTITALGRRDGLKAYLGILARHNGVP